jgi:uncharacterized protein YcnI
VADPAWAHVTVAPAEAPARAEQRYAISVQGEKPVPTTRVEIEFPRELHVRSVEAPPGWTAASQSGHDGRIVAATWTGGTIASAETVHFDVLARNPDVGVVLRWTVIQTYGDGSEVHWNGPTGGEFPAATSRVVASGLGLSGRLLAVLVVVSCLVLGGAIVRRRRRRVAAPP